MMRVLIGSASSDKEEFRMTFVKKHPAGLVSFFFSLILLLVACSSTSQIPQTSTPIATTPSKVLPPTAQKPEPTGTLTPGNGGGTGWIAFGCNPDPTHSQNDICVSKLDGSGMRQLTHSLVNQASLTPVWSHDGKRILYRVDTDCPHNCQRDDIWLMNADGSGKTNLTNNPEGANWGASWSPDGTQIVFNSSRDAGYPQLYLMDVGGSHVKHLLSTMWGEGPVWSPDGKKIAFSSNSIHVNGRDDFDIYVMNVDGSGVTRLTTTRGNDGVTSWSPDSKRLAFYSYRDGHPEVYVMNANGSSQTRLTRGPVNSASSMAYWSPDGTKILYTYSSDTNETSIYVMNADGSGQTKLMDVWSGGGDAVWQP